MRTMTRWKVCPHCNEQLFADDLNFGRYVSGEFKEVCKGCFHKEKIEKEKNIKIAYADHYAGAYRGTIDRVSGTGTIGSGG